jgi:hypothetical protein
MDKNKLILKILKKSKLVKPIINKIWIGFTDKQFKEHLKLIKQLKKFND